MGARVLICSLDQKHLKDCIQDLLQNEHSLIMIDSWSQELINPLNLHEIDIAIIEVDFFGGSAWEVLDRMRQVCDKAEIILLSNEDLESSQNVGYTIVQLRAFARHYTDILAHHGMKLGKAREAKNYMALPVLERPRILFIDDDESARDILKIILSKAGYQVEEADSARVGLALLRRFAMEGTPFAAIIVDLMMPGMDGFEFLQQLRGGKWANDTPVIISSSRNDPKTINQVYRYNIAGYVLKPYQPQLLLDQVAEAVEIGIKLP